MHWLREFGPGILLALLVALVASWLGHLIPLVGAPVFGIILGIIINNTLSKPRGTAKGIGFTSKKILQLAIVILGGSMSLTRVWEVGAGSLWVLLFTLASAFLTAFGVGKVLGVSGKMTSLIGMGTAICGGSAIVAISPIIEADEMEIAYSISTVFLFNVFAVLIFPPLGHLIGFSDQAFGLWAGTAINDTSSVVAAGYAYSNLAGAYATIVKLTRTTMIIPISLIFALVVGFQKRKTQGNNSRVHFSFLRIFPWFIVGFLATSLLNTLGCFPGTIPTYLNDTGKFLIVLALSAIGLNADFRKMIKTGLRPIALGMIVWFVVAVVSVLVQRTLGQI
ncbi:YeiH family protein [Phosphitispora fastidiosa]|uniref:YeiH family protein n=1 Tax=Phosphitispora fastidiosa TaxID=2837202 RepID=UPI001E3CA4DB|nr:putative sulfate exporter family transporter [Phosphitispora fastidiosa]MBU7008783.1 putative integral membrane protein (TIGR00698 family) [Phosphitispora fastidiosa]